MCGTRPSSYGSGTDVVYAAFAGGLSVWPAPLPMAIALGEKDNGRSLDLSLGDQLELVLPENRTTGFRWHVVADGSPVCELHEDVPARSTVIRGRPGQRRWRLKVQREGESELRLAYRRTWESVAPARTFHLWLRVGLPTGANR